ncbi:hypothetical protein HK101_001010 [Irineochytrium annulatum]|nr:hypothetical protein HK101_001010 [Irineochytrium annulatum]
MQPPPDRAAVAVAASEVNAAVLAHRLRWERIRDRVAKRKQSDDPHPDASQDFSTKKLKTHPVVRPDADRPGARDARGLALQDAKQQEPAGSSGSKLPTRDGRGRESSAVGDARGGNGGAAPAVPAKKLKTESDERRPPTTEASSQPTVLIARPRTVSSHFIDLLPKTRDSRDLASKPPKRRVLQRAPSRRIQLDLQLIPEPSIAVPQPPPPPPLDGELAEKYFTPVALAKIERKRQALLKLPGVLEVRPTQVTCRCGVIVVLRQKNPYEESNYHLHSERCQWHRAVLASDEAPEDLKRAVFKTLRGVVGSGPWEFECGCGLVVPLADPDRGGKGYDIANYDRHKLVCNSSRVKRAARSAVKAQKELEFELARAAFLEKWGVVDIGPEKYRCVCGVVAKRDGYDDHVKVCAGRGMISRAGVGELEDKEERKVAVGLITAAGESPDGDGEDAYEQPPPLVNKAQQISINELLHGNSFDGPPVEVKEES